MGTATGPLYKVAFRRRRANLTDFSKRLGLIKSPNPRLVVRASCKGIVAQLVGFDARGDRVVASAHSAELDAYGWLSQANTPTAYLCGLLAGQRAKKAGVKTTHLDLGMKTPSKGNLLFAAGLGAKAAGLQVGVPDELVDAPRLEGSHIAAYAQALKSKDDAKFRKHFSRYIAKNIDVTALPKVFAAAKAKILSG
ncbi:MAG: 50S ribosomal protein L18 [Candidatus Micrarchaeota archaeon]